MYGNNLLLGICKNFEILLKTEFFLFTLQQRSTSMKLAALLILSALLTTTEKPSMNQVNERQMVVEIHSTACAKDAACSECVEGFCAGITISRDELACEDQCEEDNLHN